MRIKVNKEDKDILFWGAISVLTAIMLLAMALELLAWGIIHG